MPAGAAPGAILLLSGVVFAQFQPLERPVLGDPAIWDYMAQVIARGGVPYRDAVDFKTPLAGYISAMAIGLAEPLGLRQIFAIRFTYLLLAALTVLMTYVVARDYSRSQRVAALASLVMLSFDQFGYLNAIGTEPKTPGILFGLVTLWAIYHWRPLLAGLSGMLATLCWQPMLLFLAVAGLAFSGYLLRWRRRPVAILGLGAAVPLLLTLLYFWAAGALDDFYLWTWHFNLTQHGPRLAQEGKVLLARGPSAVSYFFPREKLYFLVAAIVLAVMSLAAAWRSARQARQGRWAELSAAARSDALLIAPLIYLAFTTTNLQGARDLLPLLPFVAILSAWAAVRCLDLVTGRLLGKGAALVRWRAGVAAGLAAVILFFTVGDAFSSAAPELRLREQERDVAQIVRHVGPDDTIFSHDAAGLLVLAGLNNGNEFFFVQRHLAGYFDAHVPGGFERWLAQQRARRPAVVVIGPRPMSHERQIEAWLDQDYEEQRHRTYRWYLRKDLAPG